jgi:hypothetical protein
MPLLFYGSNYHDDRTITRYRRGATSRQPIARGERGVRGLRRDDTRALSACAGLVTGTLALPSVERLPSAVANRKH